MRETNTGLRRQLLIRFATWLLIAYAPAGFIAPASFAQTAAMYDATTRYLSIPSVQAQGMMYSNVVIRLDAVTIVNMGAMTPDSMMNMADAATYDGTMRNLTLPSVSVLGATYYGMIARLDSFAVIRADMPMAPVYTGGTSTSYYYY